MTAQALWRFSRPHTIIGSVVSICTLYVIVCDRATDPHILLLVGALVIGVACNVFIVGINQLADVDIDRINKPELPLPAGMLTRVQAWAVVLTALGLCLGLALWVSPWLFAIVALATFIGWAYSMPPLHLKRHHLTAALAITTVRGLLVNLGGFLVYDHLVNGTVHVPMEVWVITGFILAFSTTIAWFKDLPDLRGDARYGIRTLALRTSPRTALLAGHLLVGAAYLFTIGVLWLHLDHTVAASERTRMLLVGHAVLLLLFLMNARMLREGNTTTVRRFYRRFWWFFFAEYGLFLFAYLLPIGGTA